MEIIVMIHIDFITDIVVYGLSQWSASSDICLFIVAAILAIFAKNNDYFVYIKTRSSDYSERVLFGDLAK